MKKTCKRVLATSMSMALAVTSAIPAFAKTLMVVFLHVKKEMLNFL